MIPLEALQLLIISMEFSVSLEMNKQIDTPDLKKLYGHHFTFHEETDTTTTSLQPAKP
jgi:hypothetical protein